MEGIFKIANSLITSLVILLSILINKQIDKSLSWENGLFITMLLGTLMVFGVQFYLPKLLVSLSFVKKRVYGKNIFLEGTWLNIVKDSSGNIINASKCIIELTEEGLRYSGDNYTLDGQKKVSSFYSNTASFVDKNRKLNYTYTWNDEYNETIGFGYVSFDKNLKITTNRTQGGFSDFNTKKDYLFMGYKLSSKDVNAWEQKGKQARKTIIEKVIKMI